MGLNMRKRTMVTEEAWRAEWEVGLEEDGALLESAEDRSIWEASLQASWNDEETPREES